MREQLAWALERAREQALALVDDVRPEDMCVQAVPGGRHPAWILGHLLLADTYLLFLLGTRELPSDFPALLRTCGPGAMPTSDAGVYDAKALLVRRLVETGALRVGVVRDMTTGAFERPLPDDVLARAQPTVGHHLQSQVFHEGYHNGQLSSWRKARGLTPGRWTFGPDGVAE